MNYDAFKEYSTFKKYFERVQHGGGRTQQISPQDKTRMTQLQKKLLEEIE